MPYSDSCDVWAFGVCAWEIHCRAVPFAGMGAVACATKVRPYDCLVLPMFSLVFPRNRPTTLRGATRMSRARAACPPPPG